MFAQANFMEMVGAILPNARIDFQLSGVPPPPSELPHLSGSQEKVGQACFEAVLSDDCSTARTLESPMGTRPQLEPEGEPDSPPDSYDTYDDNSYGYEPTPESVVFGTFGAKTPESGTPEWSPRCINTHDEQAAQIHQLDCTMDSKPAQELQIPVFDYEGATPQVCPTDYVMHDGLCQDIFGCGQPQPSVPIPDHTIATKMCPQGPATWVGAQISPPEHMRQGQQTQAPGAVWCDAVEQRTWYRVAFLGGIELRVQPSFLAARTGVLLPQNEVFAVSAEIVGADGRIYLRLGDGRGWAFDDSALLPHDPSVVRGHFTEGAMPAPVPVAAASSPPQQMHFAEGSPSVQAHMPECPAPHLLPTPCYPNHGQALPLPAHAMTFGAPMPFATHEQSPPLQAQPLAFGANSLPAQFPYAHPGSLLPVEQAPPPQFELPRNAPNGVSLPAPSPFSYPGPTFQGHGGAWPAAQPSFSSHSATSPFDPPSAMPHQVVGSLRNHGGSLRNPDPPAMLPHQVVGSLRNPGARQVDPAPLQAQLSHQWAQKPLQAELSQQWSQMEHGFSPLLAGDCAPTQASLVTSDCPPMWEPSVPSHTDNFSHQGQCSQYF